MFEIPNIDPAACSLLRYGDNPQQSGRFCPTDTQDPLAFARFKHVHGPELSHTNWLDADNALLVLSQIGIREPACSIVKHAIPCGAATSTDLESAFKRAWAGDSMAAFGSVVAINRPVDEPFAKTLLGDRRVIRGLLTPSVTESALGQLSRRRNLWVMTNPALTTPIPRSGVEWRSIRGGLLVQDAYDGAIGKNDVESVSERQPTDAEWEDVRFAWGLVVATRSNAISIVRDRQLVGSGAGQQDRLRACQIAVAKAGDRAPGAVAASDGFFPFAFGDGPEVLLNAGVTAIIQPAGSKNDRQVIDLCNMRGAALLFTRGIRGFRH